MKIQKYFEFKKNSLEPVKSFRIKDNLDSKLWDGLELDSKVRKDLLRIGEDFFDSTDIKAPIVDIVLCGSLCNYNWSEKYSDFDLHIIVNFDEIDEDYELAEKLCDLSKKKWNWEHDIKIKGYDVEVAIQDNKELYKEMKAGKMGGVFSLKNNEWIKIPKKVNFVPNENLIKIKAKNFMLEIDDIEKESKTKDYDSIKNRIKKVWDKIKKIRKESLDEEGEYGLGNLVFKTLRRNEYLTKIVNLKTSTYDKQFENKNKHTK